MRRLLVMLVIFALAAGAGLAVRRLLTGSVVLRVVDAQHGLAALKLTADRQVTPLGGDGLRPGSRFRYTFSVTNAGNTVLRHVVVRSIKIVPNAIADHDMAIVSISDPSCWGVGHCDCIFQRLGPGETRTVTVTAAASPQRRAGELLQIHTFIGRFAQPVSGSLPLEVVGGTRMTTGRFR